MWTVEVSGKRHENLSLKKIFDLRGREDLVICGSPGKFINYKEFRNLDEVRGEFDKLEGAAKKQGRSIFGGYQTRSRASTEKRLNTEGSTIALGDSEIEEATIVGQPGGTSTPAVTAGEERKILEKDISGASLEDIHSILDRVGRDKRKEEHRAKHRSRSEEERSFDRGLASNNRGLQFRTQGTSNGALLARAKELFRGVLRSPEDNDDRRGHQTAAANVHGQSTPAREQPTAAAGNMASNGMGGGSPRSGDNPSDERGELNRVPFKDAIKYIKPYCGKKEKCHLFVRDCERAFAAIKPSDRNSLFVYILSQLEGVESELIGNRVFNNWEELHKYLTGSFLKLGEINLATEMGKFTTLHQGDTEETQSYFDRAYQFKRRVDLIASKPEHQHFHMLEQANTELVRAFVYGLRSEQFRFTLSQDLPKSLEEVLDRVEKWEFIPGYATPSRFTAPIRAVNNAKTGCVICDARTHSWEECPTARDTFVNKGGQNQAVAPQPPSATYGGDQGRNGVYHRPYPGNYANRNGNYRYPQPRGNYYQNNYQGVMGQGNGYQPRQQRNVEYQGNNIGQQMQQGGFNQGNNGGYPRAAVQSGNRQGPYDRNNAGWRNSGARGNQQVGPNEQRPDIRGYINNVGSIVGRYIRVTVNGFEARALIDTGASVSLIKAKLVTQGFMKTRSGELTGIGGTVTALGTTLAIIDLGPVVVKSEFYVVEDDIVNPYDLYIGVNILEDQNWSIDLKGNRLTANGHEIEIFRSKLNEMIPINKLGPRDSELIIDGMVDIEVMDEQDDSDYDEEQMVTDLDDEGAYYHYDFYYDDMGEEEWDEQADSRSGNDTFLAEEQSPVITDAGDNQQGQGSAGLGVEIGEEATEVLQRRIDSSKEMVEEVAKGEERPGPVVISEEERERFKRDILEEFAEVFGEIEAIASSRIRPFEIRLKAGVEPFRTKLYRLSPQ